METSIKSFENKILELFPSRLLVPGDSSDNFSPQCLRIGRVDGSAPGQSNPSVLHGEERVFLPPRPTFRATFPIQSKISTFPPAPFAAAYSPIQSNAIMMMMMIPSASSALRNVRSTYPAVGQHSRALLYCVM